MGLGFDVEVAVEVEVEVEAIELRSLGRGITSVGGSGGVI